MFELIYLIYEIFYNFRQYKFGESTGVDLFIKESNIKLMYINKVSNSRNFLQ